MMRGVGGVMKSEHQSWLAKGLGLGLLCWGFKVVEEEFPSEEASTLQIESVAFPPGQCTSPQLHPCQRLFEQDGHQDITLPIVQTLLQGTFGYSLSSEDLFMRQLRRRKSLWRRSLTHSHKRSSMGPCRSCWNGTKSALQLEVIASKVTRVLCVLSIKVPIRNKSENLFNDPRIYIYLINVWWKDRFHSLSVSPCIKHCTW